MYRSNCETKYRYRRSFPHLRICMQEIDSFYHHNSQMQLHEQELLVQSKSKSTLPWWHPSHLSLQCHFGVLQCWHLPRQFSLSGTEKEAGTGKYCKTHEGMILTDKADKAATRGRTRPQCSNIQWKHMLHGQCLSAHKYFTMRYWSITSRLTLGWLDQLKYLHYKPPYMQTGCQRNKQIDQDTQRSTFKDNFK